MRYASIRKMDISNGVGLGIALFVQGCHFHCKGCFNQETWDFNDGEEWTKNTEEEFLALLDNPYIDRVSILGGEPLCEENISTVTKLAKLCKERYPDKLIWIWSGYEFKDHISDLEIVKYADYIIDGVYVDSLKDFNLYYRGSKNQHIWKKENRNGTEKWRIYDNEFDMQ